jgi:hypothetical protein
MKWREAAGAAAPILTSILPPPFSRMADYAVREALGLDKRADERVLDELIASGDPHVIARVREAEMALLKHAREMQVDLEELLQKDRESARKMATDTKSFTPFLLTWTSLIMLAVELLYIVMEGGIPDSLNNAFGGALLLAPLTLAQQGFNFFLGSSMGSVQKNAMFKTK